MCPHPAGRRALAALATIALGALTTGCAAQRMQPVKQLDHMEFVVDGAIDFPGAFFIPRLGAQGTLGLGGVSDVSLNLNTSLFRTQAGLGARYYVADWLTMGLQASYAYHLNESELRGDATSNHLMLTARPAFRWYDAKRFAIYGGPQVSMFVIKGVDFDGVSPSPSGMRPELLSMGLFAGGAINMPSSSIQFEVVVAPLWLDISPSSSLGPDRTFPASDSVQFGASYVLYLQELLKEPERDKVAPPSPAPEPKLKPAPKPQEPKPQDPKPQEPKPQPDPAPAPVDPPAAPQPQPTPPEEP